jgi:hypothetical protein
MGGRVWRGHSLCKERERDCFPRLDAWYAEICLGSVNQKAEITLIISSIKL